MNTSQRNIIRIGCYVLAGLSLLAVMDGGFAPLIAAIVLVIVGKVVWAGRPLAQIASLGSDALEIARVAAKIEAAHEQASSAPVVQPTAAAIAAPVDPAPEVVGILKCYQCGAENKGDAYNCVRCSALMRSRRR
jgi:hypothetical protein